MSPLPQQTPRESLGIIRTTRGEGAGHTPAEIEPERGARDWLRVYERGHQLR
jgi:hypothetical protein